MARNDSEQRTRILEAAVGVFAQNGLRGATTRLVGRAAGVNSALLYYYFENKTVLFEEAIRLVVGGFLDHLKRRMKTFRNAKDRLAFLIDGIFSYYQKHPDRMLLMQLAVTRHPEVMGRVLGSYLKEGMPSPIWILQEGMQKGELRTQHPLHAWWSLLSLSLFSLNLIHLWSFVGAPTPGMPAPRISDRRDHVIDLLLNGLVDNKTSSRRNKP
jgi:TetR/AcrR family transcriptional regulator